MSARLYQGQLDSKRKQRVDAEKKTGEFRIKESTKRADAAKARLSASRSKNQSTIQSKLREADRRESEAETAGKEANRWQAKASGYAKEELNLEIKLARAKQMEADAVERKRKREQLARERREIAERTELQSRISHSELTIDRALRQLPAPKSEKLRVLILGASSSGDLRVGREQKRIRAAVESALHRDQIDLDVRPAATTDDLLDGITKFRPHIVHFSGHSNDELIVFERELDEPHEGAIISAHAFARALSATDDPPLLILLNSCNSATQIGDLVEQVAPFAIGMANVISDGDAINYAAQFYAAVANGQSINSAHMAGQARLELDGLDSADLPTLAFAPDVDPGLTVLVSPPA
ncbi:hypothetical protein N24_0043 [Corynebacterium suranareeae]|uniref:CHAT domain-containing protein n=1 Tax=Corynebacterium suranareeae TaxID=2506452 RepID=A0A160PM97_9CORY|nr:CHAT domain-containing protein [Corynebacterium suranareeae]BAU94305.1 hypothetical protein N24_0043 [Corynebacterium suranareeae]